MAKMVKEKNQDDPGNKKKGELSTAPLPAKDWNMNRNPL